MIEQIHGAGLSGITGKTNSHSKNSLFAALMGMLEKHTQGSGKGLLQQAMLSGKDQINKGLQQQSTLSGKSPTGKGKSLFAMNETSDTLTAKKHDKLLILATKGKHEKKKVDVTAIPVIANHVISDLTISVKKTTKTAARKVAKAMPGFSSEQVHSQNKQASPGGQAESRIQQPLKNEALPASATAQPSANKKSQSPVHRRGVALTDTASGAVKANPAAQQAQVMDSNKTGFPVSVKQGLTDASRQTISNSTSQASTVDGASRQAISNSTDQAATVYTGIVGETVIKANHKSADASSMQSAAATKPGDASVLVQQSQKMQQNRNSANISSLANNMTAGSPDTMLLDSGSHASDSGRHQDGNNFQILASDIRSGTAPSSSHTQFQHYMSDKTAPSMTLFESMQHIAHSARKGKSQLEIQLEPAHLGKIQILLQSDAAKQLHVHMIVDQSVTRQLIDQQLPALKHALAQQGLDLSGFSMGSQDQHASSGGGSHAHSQKGNNMITHKAGSTAEPPHVSASTNLNRTAVGAGLSIRI